MAVLLGLAGPAHADSLQDCLDQAANHNGEPPTCTEVNGKYVASWDDDLSSGIPSGFIALMVLVGIAGVGLTVWKVSTARKLAAESGMDPGLATQVTLLSDDGLGATYLASSLRKAEPPAQAADAVTHGKTVSDRLGELRGLLDSAVVTQAEYDERRTAILDEV